jgi:hypothetical protein
VVVVNSVEEALRQVRETDEVIAIGGAEIYRLFMPFARRIYLTQVHAELPGDTIFPDFDPTQWVDAEYSEHPADEKNAYDVTFVTLERKTGAAVAAVALARRIGSKRRSVTSFSARAGSRVPEVSNSIRISCLHGAAALGFGVGDFRVEHHHGIAGDEAVGEATLQVHAMALRRTKPASSTVSRISV